MSFCVCVIMPVVSIYCKNGGQNALLVIMPVVSNLLHKLTHLVRIGSDSVIVFNDVINVIMFSYYCYYVLFHFVII